MKSNLCKFVVFLIIQLLQINLLAQSPNIIQIGQDELSNINIYDAYYDNNKDFLYIGTNEGLFRYAQNKFEAIPVSSQTKSNSFFQLKANSKGEIFCFNLYGQIFKLENNEWQLFFEDKNFNKDSYTDFIINQKDEIIFFSSGNLIKIEENGSSVDLLKKNGLKKDELQIRRTISPYSTGAIIASGTYNNKAIILNLFNDSISLTPIIGEPYVIPFKLNDKLFDYGLSDFNCPEGIKTDLSPIHSKCCLSYEKNAFARHRTTGLSRLFLKNDSLKRKVIFKNHFISELDIDKKQTAFLTSFKNGVKVVSKIEQLSYLLPERQITSLTSLNDEVCFVGTQDGSLVRFKNDSSQDLIKNREIAIEFLYLDKERNLVILPQKNGIDNNKSQLGNTLTFNTFFKEIIRVKDDYFSFVNNKVLKQNIDLNLKYETVFENDRKIISINVNSKKQELNLSDTEKTLIKNLNDDEPKILKHNQKKFKSNRIISWNEKSVYATEKNGILVFESNRFIKQITEKDGLFSKNIKQIEIKDDILYILCKGKLQVYDLIKKHFIAVGFQDGLGFEPVQFISVAKNKVWIAELSKVYTVDIADLLEPNFPEPIYIDSILVNGNRLNLSSKDFDYTQKDLKIYYDYRNLLSKNDVSIQYQLVGYDDEWNSVSAFENLIEFQSLAPGEYEFKLKASIGKNEGKMFTYSFSISPPYWQRGWFYLFIVVVTLVIAYLVFRRIIARQRKRSKEMLEKERLSSNLASSQLKALRAQMNPHFIFNSLNSIQNLILKQDTDGSYDYVSQFAQLVRSSLDYSEQDFVSLRKEIEFLNVYLNLESLRFEEDFTFEIKDDTQDFDLEIPSLLIQPFIENALLHGLLHKKGEKRLTVHFEKEEKLICSITDNGVGRKKAKEIKTRQGVAHESFSTSAIQKRLELFSEKMNQKTEVFYEDLFDEEGLACGTKVILRLPFQTI